MKFVMFSFLLAALTSAPAFSQAVPASRTLVGEISHIDHDAREVRLLTQRGEIEVDYEIVSRFARKNEGIVGRKELAVGQPVGVIFLNEPDAVDTTVEFVEILGKDDPRYREFAASKSAIDRSVTQRAKETRIHTARAMDDDRVHQATNRNENLDRERMNRNERDSNPRYARLPETASALPLIAGLGGFAGILGACLRVARRRR